MSEQRRDSKEYDKASPVNNDHEVRSTQMCSYQQDESTENCSFQQFDPFFSRNRKYRQHYS